MSSRIRYSRVTTGPTIEPISVAEAKVQCKLEDDFTDDDDLLRILIQAARELVEETTGRSLITQTRVIKFDSFPCSDSMFLSNGRLLAVTSVEYYNDSEALTTLDSSDYWVDDHSEIPRIVIKDSWPSTYDRPNAVVVTYTAGYGAAASYIPAPLIQAIKIIVASLYDHRGDEKGFQIPDLAMTLMGPHIITSNAWY